ncbi:MAG TPA: hypothetical protein VFD20_04185, partial [Demequina sp.]|nr:hypothetical protein [Demequina sp.]
APLTAAPIGTLAGGGEASAAEDLCRRKHAQHTWLFWCVGQVRCRPRRGHEATRRRQRACRSALL